MLSQQSQAALEEVAKFVIAPAVGIDTSDIDSESDTLPKPTYRRSPSSANLLRESRSILSNQSKLIIPTALNTSEGIVANGNNFRSKDRVTAAYLRNMIGKS